MDGLCGVCGRKAAYHTKNGFFCSTALSMNSVTGVSPLRPIFNQIPSQLHRELHSRRSSDAGRLPKPLDGPVTPRGMGMTAAWATKPAGTRESERKSGDLVKPAATHGGVAGDEGGKQVDKTLHKYARACNYGM